MSNLSRRNASSSHPPPSPGEDILHLNKKNKKIKYYGSCVPIISSYADPPPPQSMIKKRLMDERERKRLPSSSSQQLQNHKTKQSQKQRHEQHYQQASHREHKQCSGRDILIPSIPPTPVDEADREEALKLLHKSEIKKKKLLKKKLDQQISIELGQMYHESERRREERLRALLESEKQREYECKKKLKLLEENCFEMFRKKKVLIQKLVELQTKHRITEIGQKIFPLSNIPVKTMTYDEMIAKSIEKQREIINQNVHNARGKLVGSFVSEFEKFTRIPHEEEMQEIREEIEKFLQPYLKKREEIIEKSRKWSEIVMQETCQKILQARKQEAIQQLEIRQKQEHERKCKILQEAKDAVGLTPDEIEDLLELPIIPYVTDIGIADAKMEELRKKIFAQYQEQEEIRKHRNQQINSIKLEIDMQRSEINNTRVSIRKLKDNLKILKKEHKRLKHSIQQKSSSDFNKKMNEALQRESSIETELRSMRKKIETIRINLKEKSAEYWSKREKFEEEEKKRLELTRNVKDLWESDNEMNLSSIFQEGSPSERNEQSENETEEQNLA